MVVDNLLMPYFFIGEGGPLITKTFQVPKIEESQNLYKLYGCKAYAQGKTQPI